MQKVVILIFAIILCQSVGCVFPGVHKIDVQQGNIIEKETLSQLKTGMNRKQVHFVLGTPVLETTFDPSYETYLYTIQVAGGEVHRQNVTLHYQNDILQKIDTKEILSEQLANPAEARKLR